MGLKIAIIGRPNVGKSTLFNRLVQQKIALVDNVAGVTRDRRQHAARLQDLRFDVIDTAGLDEGDEASLAGRMRAQTKAAIDEADLVLFLIDAKAGILGADVEFSSLVRKSGKPIILVANKAESKQSDAGYYDSWTLGLGEPCAISAEHGLGLSDLRDAIVNRLGHKKVFAEQKVSEEALDLEDDHEDVPLLSAEAFYAAQKALTIAIVGRPNVGKSTFINTLVGEDRLLTGPEAGITRDSICLDWVWQRCRIRLWDTAGLRRKARVAAKLEKLSVAETLRAIRFAELVVVMMDATMPFEKQDLQIADLVIREGRAVVLAFNKWDNVPNKQETLSELHKKCEELLPQIRGVRAVPISGQQGYGLENLMRNIASAYQVWNQRISTGRLNRWLEGVVTHHPPPTVAGRRLKLKYITQVKARPPSFMLSCSRPQAMPQSYIRYLINSLRESFGLQGTPIRVIRSGAPNPFSNKIKKRS